MLFIYPVWDNESQRIGKQKCTPLGYRLHGIAEMLGLVGLLLLLGVGVYLGYRAFRGTFHKSLFWVLAVPFGLGVIGEVLYRYSWRLAARKEFQYDYETREASWLEDGQRRAYKWTANESLHSTPR
jgi:hypothetical protein